MMTDWASFVSNAGKAFRAIRVTSGDPRSVAVIAWDSEYYAFHQSLDGMPVRSPYGRWN